MSKGGWELPNLSPCTVVLKWEAEANAASALALGAIAELSDTDDLEGLHLKFSQQSHPDADLCDHNYQYY